MSEQDPFEDLVLDEEFVRGGAYEPPARTRAAIATHRDTGFREAAGTPSGPPRRRGRRPVVVVVAVVLAVVAGTLVATHAFGGRAHPAVAATAPTGSAAPSASSTPDEELTNDSFTVGGCYSWDQSLSATEAMVGSCSAPHLMEAVAPETITSYAAGSPYPTEAQWTAIRSALCTAPVGAFLGHALTSADLLEITSIEPLPDGWAAGQRGLECDVSDGRYRPATALTGPHAPLLVPFTGEARTLPRWWTAAPGTCATDHTYAYGKARGVVACSASHTIEYVGSTTLAGTSTYPSDSRQSALIGERCQAIADRYAGHHVTTTATRFVGSDVIDQASWTAGDRLVGCSVVDQTSKGVDVPTTGSVRSSGPTTAA